MDRPLPSWNEGTVRTAILRFVADVTAVDGPRHVPAGERLAVFDNDGTLWAEYPLLVQVHFAIAHAARMLERAPALADDPAFRALADGELQALAALPKQNVFAAVLAVHAGMSTAQFQAAADAWLADAVHPRYRRRFTDCIYQPQRELLDYLRAHGFRTCIVTGGGIDFVRVVADRLYGIPPLQVVGSSTATEFVIDGGEVQIRKLPQLRSFDDREQKPVNIDLHLGQRPILAFGNSDGDLAMLRYTLRGPGARLALLLHHDDELREAAYDRDFRLSPLDEALAAAAAEPIHLVSMQHDWRQVFP